MQITASEVSELAQLQTSRETFEAESRGTFTIMSRDGKDAPRVLEWQAGVTRAQAEADCAIYKGCAWLGSTHYYVVRHV